MQLPVNYKATGGAGAQVRCPRSRPCQGATRGLVSSLELVPFGSNKAEAMDWKRRVRRVTKTRSVFLQLTFAMQIHTGLRPTPPRPTIVDIESLARLIMPVQRGKVNLTDDFASRPCPFWC